MYSLPTLHSRQNFSSIVHWEPVHLSRERTRSLRCLSRLQELFAPVQLHSLSPPQFTQRFPRHLLTATDHCPTDTGDDLIKGSCNLAEESTMNHRPVKGARPPAEGQIFIVAHALRPQWVIRGEHAFLYRRRSMKKHDGR